eukprot:UC1_evm3s1566
MILGRAVSPMASAKNVTTTSWLCYSISCIRTLSSTAVASETNTATTPITLEKRPPHTQPPAKWQITNPRDVAGPLSRAQQDDFYRDGFVYLPKFYSAPQLKAVQEEVEEQLDHLAHRLHAAGLVRDTYAGADWTQRLLQLWNDYEHAPLVLIKEGVLPLALGALYTDSRILDVVQQLGVGPDIALNPAWNLRGKMPGHEETTVPFHQDNSYWEPRIWGEQVLTVWVALVDSNIENGCMQMIKGAHASGRTARHTLGTTSSTWYTELSEHDVAKDLRDGVPLTESDLATIECEAGSIIIFPGTTPHRSLPSTAEGVRWSTDFRLHARTAARPGFGAAAETEMDNIEEVMSSSSSSSLDWFYGLKDALLLRDATNPNYVPDMTSWAKVDRTGLQDAALGVNGKSNVDTVVVGPWMDLWDLEAPAGAGRVANRHIASYLATDESSRDPQRYIDIGNW